MKARAMRGVPWSHSYPITIMDQAYQFSVRGPEVKVSRGNQAWYYSKRNGRFTHHEYIY